MGGPSGSLHDLRPDVQAVGEAGREASVQDRTLGALPVVGDPTKLQRLVLPVPDDIARVGVAVSGLANAARIDERGPSQDEEALLVVVAQLAGLAVEAARTVGMAERAQARPEQ